jgi:hypothetical protein
VWKRTNAGKIGYNALGQNASFVGAGTKTTIYYFAEGGTTMSAH